MGKSVTKPIPNQKAFMRITKQVQRGLSKAKNAPAREYAKDPKGKGVGKAATKGLPDKGSMGAKEPPKLNAGAQAAKDLADSKRATAASREAAKRAKSPTKMAVDAGLVTKAAAKADLQKVRGGKNRARAYEKSRRPSKGPGVTTAQKVVGATTVAAVAGGVGISSDRRTKAANAPKASASTRRGGGPMAGKAKAPAPLKQAPASAVSRGGGSAVKNRPAPAKVKQKSVSKPATTKAPEASSPTIGGKTFEQMQSNYVSSGQKSYDEHTAFFKTGEVQKVNPAPQAKKDRQIGGIAGRTAGKWHLGKKKGKG